MTIDSETTIVRSSKPVETTVGTEVVLMTLESGECLGLGETGSDVWRLIEKPIQLEALVDSLGEMYQAPVGVIEQDVIELLEDMSQRGLVELS
jgi:Coenzyme PQQ synthesis protein D (PqqD)